MKVKCTFSISLLCAVVSVGAAQDRVRSFDFRNVELRTALDSLLRWYAVPLIYLESDVSGKRVTAECSGCSFEEALEKVIEGQQLTWKKVGQQVLLRRRLSESSTATLAGTIRDSLTGEFVTGANVILQGGNDEIVRWCSTNQFGFFSLRNIHAGAYILTARRIGYQTLHEQVIVQAGSSIMQDLALSEQELVHPEITVEARRSAFTASEGISHGVYIRGTPSDHNQYLLEGARIYNPLHFGGVVSTFNGDALRDVQVVAGGIPPYYGGRIGGILDVSLRNSMSQRFEGSAGIGPLGSNFVVQGPVSARTDFLISVRREYPDAFFPRYRPGDTPSDLNSSEIIARLHRQFAGNQQLSLSGYFGRDTYDKHISDMEGSQLLNSLRWGNEAANLRWAGVMSPSLFFYASAVYTRYGFNVEQRLEGVDNSRETFTSDYLIEDAALRAHAEYFYDEYHTALAGVELVRHRMGGRISEFSSQIASMSLDGFSPWELSVYFQDQWRLVPSVVAELGTRATSFIARQGSFSAVDPRFSLLVSLDDDLRLYSSLSAVNQFVHPYRSSGIFMFYPSIFLYPSTEKIPPSTSLQASLGMEKSFREDEYRFAVESYYRMTQKLHEFVYSTITRTLPDALLLGEGNTYGADLTLDKRLGDFTGSVRYSLSLASNRFPELNGGKPFRPRFDRRHEVYATVSYSLQESWTIGALCLLSSNEFPLSGPAELKASYGDVRTGPAAMAEVRYAEPYDLNGGRLPGFQRLELRMLHRFSSWDVPFEVTLRLLNGYGLVDPFAWELRQNPEKRLRWRITLDTPPLLPLYPVVSLSARF